MVKVVNKKTIFAAVAVIIAIATTVASLMVFQREETRTVLKESEIHERRSYLILGKDRASGLCDVIMIFSLDKDSGSATILQIPRDTYAVYSENGYRKLNGAVNAIGARGFCGFIMENMGVKLDGYLLFDLDVFKKAVDAIGGIDIELPFDMDYEDPYQGLSIHFQAGHQHLDGSAAEKFVRYRSGYIRGDIGRLDAQKLFLSAAFKKLRETSDPAVIMRLVFSVIGEVETDISLPDIWELAGAVRSIDPEGLSMITLPGEDVRPTENGAWFYVLSRVSTEEVLSRYLGIVGSFDPERRFTNERYDSFRKIYGSEAKIYAPNASEIEKNGIDIPKR